MTEFRYLSLNEFEALDADQKEAYINAALDRLIAKDALVPLRVDKLRSPDPNAATAPTPPPPHEAPPQQPPQQQQHQPPPAQDAEPPAPDKDNPA